MDIPSVRFVFPALVLYAFYWAFIANPWMPDGDEESDDPARISQEQARLLLRRSQQFLAQRRFDQALPPLLELHRAYPQSDVYMRQLAGLYHETGRFQEEAAMWELFLQYAPIPVDGCPQIGVAYRRLEREADAYRSFERCLAIEENSDNLFYMGHALERRGQYRKAEEHYEKALQRSPGYPDVIIGLSRVQVFLDKAAHARERILKFVEARPDSADALLVAGMASIKTGHFAEARDFLRRGRRLRPQDSDFRVALARAGRMSGARAP